LISVQPCKKICQYATSPARFASRSGKKQIRLDRLISANKSDRRTAKKTDRLAAIYLFRTQAIHAGLSALA
jgi:hypothetical protein